MLVILILSFYIVGCVLGLINLNIYLYIICQGDIFRIITYLKYNKKLIFSLLFSWITVLIQLYIFFKNENN